MPSLALDGLSKDAVVKTQLGAGVPVITRPNAGSTVASKEILG